MTSILTHPVSRRHAVAGLGALAATAVVGAGARPAAAARAEWGGSAPLIGPAGGEKLHVMGFNIRYDRAGTAPGLADFWPDRAPLVEQLLRVEQPTLLGVQEAEFNQLPAIEAGLPAGYRMIGYGRDGGNRGEYSAIYFNAQRLALLEWDQFWLSDTPDVIGSATWGNTVTRVAVWGRFRDKNTGREFVAANTHFDHQSEPARAKSATMLVGLAERFPGLPMVLTGDFNAVAGDSAAYATLVGSGPFGDSWLTAEKKVSAGWGTFPNYAEPADGGDRIDWLLTTPGSVRVHSAAISTWTKGGRWPSDHTPVQALVSL